MGEPAVGDLVGVALGVTVGTLVGSAPHISCSAELTAGGCGTAATQYNAVNGLLPVHPIASKLLQAVLASRPIIRHAC